MPQSQVITVETESATAALAARFAAIARQGDAFLLSGPLGAGKSAFARAFLRARAGDPALEVPSPSFTLVQEYDLPGGPVWHFDLWRLSGPGELTELGFDAARAGIMLVEWPERLGDEAPDDALTITFALAPEAPSARRITLTGDRRWFDEA